MQYQLEPAIQNINVCSITRINDDETLTFIPSNMDNADCAKFVSDWQSGMRVLDSNKDILPYSTEALSALSILGI